MDPKQLRETTMDPHTRTLLQVQVDPDNGDVQLVDELMGRRPELRLAFIQANAGLVEELDV
jgi:topoisomerase-4 subunit B